MDGIQWGDVLLDWLRRLHTGAAFGTAGRIALALIGLAIVVLNGASLYTWPRERRGGRTKPDWSASLQAARRQ
jgi:uncharacterized iron-regulated membrane protein